MKIYTYGEDALTLWALKNKLKELIGEYIGEPVIFYRPSFGRSGGDNSSQFGEFDFIIITDTTVFLGESKWDSSSEIKGEMVTLRDEQIKRHEIMKEYIKYLYKTGREIKNWDKFKESIQSQIQINVIPDGTTVLAQNLKFILNQVMNKAGKQEPEVRNLLVVFTRKKNQKFTANVEGFELKTIEYSNDLEKNYLVQAI